MKPLSMIRLSLALASLVALAIGMAQWTGVRMGRQPDGSFLVSTGQRIEGGSIAFTGRPIDLALHPTRDLLAVLNKNNVFLVTADRLKKGTEVPLGSNAGFRGLVWTPGGDRLLASTEEGHIQSFRLSGDTLQNDVKIKLAPEGQPANPVPGGMVITRDGSRLFVAAANRNAVVEVDLTRNIRIREYSVQALPFEPRLTDDESAVLVSNWAGHPPRPGERSAKSQYLDIVVNEQGAAASGSVSLIDLKSGNTRHVEVGVHPTAIAVTGSRAYVANAMSDSISEIDVPSATVTRTIPLRWGALRLLGGMPNALAIRRTTLYVADGGDNAIAEVNLETGQVTGFRPAGFFPVAIALSHDGGRAFVLNTKGNGSVSKTTLGKPGNAHDFQGTITVLDLARDLDRETSIVARDNRWNTNPGPPALRVYNGGVKHVLYIIKENRTYDEVFGDLPIGNGDPELCSLGETVMPNHRKIAREFTLFDNGYVSGTNSADGHAWATQCMANEYLELFYVGYSRTYPDDGDDAMAISNAGALWDAAARKQKSIRVYGEFCDNELARFEPMPKDWFEVWEDRLKGTRKFKMTADTTVASLRPYINREVHYWPLFQSDQYRADVFIREYEEFSRRDAVPDLTILSLPCDHSEGVDPKYPTPRAMMADNDLALGRVVEAVSNSPQWKDTAIFVIEDDAQSGPDHVDGHRTVFMVISPYTKRAFVDSTFYAQTSMVRSMELILGLDPMNRFDALAEPITTCFIEEPDVAPYHVIANKTPLDERNPAGTAMNETDRFWLDKTRELDWSHIDGPDSYWLNRIIWYSIHKGSRPYPSRAGEEPGRVGID